ncbi:MAG: SslE/AcfD family lipoprotein zinc metalloprotease, partial [Enterovibrio sp.]
MNAKKVLIPTLLSLLLSACLHDEQTSTPCIGDACNPQPQPPVNPEPDPGVSYLSATLLASGMKISGDVTCNGESLAKGEFKVAQGTPFSCEFGSVTLGSFTAPPPPARELMNGNTPSKSFDLQELHGENAAKVLQTIDHCASSDLCLKELDHYDIINIFSELGNDEAVAAFLKLKEEQAVENVGNAPSSHTDKTLVPQVSSGTTNDLNGKFVAAEAEKSLAYKPSAEARVSTTARLINSAGKPIEGIEYFSAGSKGVTGENGEFEFMWGDEITFGLDTFELGKVKGNQLTFTISDVTDSAIKKTNIENLI